MRLMSKILGLAFLGGIMLLGASHASAMLLTQATTATTTLCVDVEAASTAANAVVWAYPCNGTMAEQWNFVGSELQGLAPGKCLSTAGGATVAGTAVVLNPCTGAKFQKWAYYLQEIYLLGTSPALCLDAVNGTQKQLVITACGGSAAPKASQQWTLH